MNQQLTSQFNMIKFLIKAAYQVILVNLLFSIIYWAVFTGFDTWLNAFNYWLKYIIMPLAITTIATYISSKWIYSDRFSLSVKKYIIIFLMIFIACVLSIIHNIVIVLLLGFFIPIFVSTLFSDTLLTTITYLVSQVMLFVVATINYLITVREYGSYLFTETLVSTGMLLVAYLMSKVIINYNEANIRSMDIMYNEKMELEGKINIDALTGIYNRRAFDTYLKKTFTTTKEKNGFLALVILDIDDFKEINDTYGHTKGDEALMNLSNVLLRHQSENIHVFRIGGDEFAIIIEQSMNIDDFMTTILSDERIYNEMQTSYGYASYNLEMDNEQTLFEMADSALYQTKRKNKYKRI